MAPPQPISPFNRRSTAIAGWQVSQFLLTKMDSNIKSRPWSNQVTNAFDYNVCSQIQILHPLLFPFNSDRVQHNNHLHQLVKSLHLGARTVLSFGI